MNLTLEVISQNGQSLGAARRKVFGPEGGRIGRAPDCDWILANPYISRHHATVRWISGTYYIESTGENGVAINSQQAMLPRLERRALNAGDHIFIDEYEVVVGLGVGAAQPAQPPAPSVLPPGFIPDEDPFATPPHVAAPSPRGLVEQLEPAAEELDPLKRLFGGSANVTPLPAPIASWNHTPGTSDHYSPPPVQAPPGPVIPDDWDKTSFGMPEGRTAAGAPASAATPGASGVRPVVIPDDWDQTSFSRGRVPGAPGPAGTGTPQAAPPVTGGGTASGPMPPGGRDGTPQTPLMPRRPEPAGLSTRPFLRPVAPPPAAVPPTAGPVPPGLAPAYPNPAAPQRFVPPAQAPATTAAETQSRPGGLDVTALLRAAGVDPATVSLETVAALGLILRSVTQGVIEVLQARGELKNQFRLAATRVKMEQNNPLKFAVNAEDALNSLLARRNQAYLGPVEAFEDAFDDIRYHQMAMLAGIRAGFEHVLSRFEPERLQELFDKRGKRSGLLALSAKARYWEMYAEEFHERMGDRDEAFRRFFAEQFANAYEQQFEALKLKRT